MLAALPAPHTTPAPVRAAARAIGVARTFRPLLTSLAFALAYYAGARIGFALQSPVAPQSLLWLPNSIMLSVLLVEPRQRWPRYFAAALPAQLLIAVQSHAPVVTMLLLYLTNCADASLGALLVKRVARGRIDLRHLRGMLQFMLCAAIAAPLLLSFLDAAITTLTGWGSDYGVAYATRARSNILTHMVVVPTLVSALNMPLARWRAMKARPMWIAAGALAALVAASVITFAPSEGPSQLLFAALGVGLTLGLLLTIAVQFGPGLTGAGLLTLAFVLSWEVIHSGASVGSLPAGESVSAVQLVLLCVTIPFLCLASVTQERRRETRALARTYSRLRTVMRDPHNSPPMGSIAVTTGEIAMPGGMLSQVAVAGPVTGELDALSHELRQPLSAIRNNAQAGLMYLAADPPRLEALRAVLHDIVADDTHAAQVLDRSQTFVRNDQSAMGPVDINDVCERATRVVRAQPGLSGSQFEVTLDAGLPKVQGDAVQLQQVVLNLVLNAVEATSHQVGDERCIHLATSRVGQTVLLTVIDSGPGIPGNLLDFLFQPFFTTKASGMGMGLAIVHSIVEHHRGSVAAANAPGGGAILTVSLPVDFQLPSGA